MHQILSSPNSRKYSTPIVVPILYLLLQSATIDTSPCLQLTWTNHQSLRSLPHKNFGIKHKGNGLFAKSGVVEGYETLMFALIPPWHQRNNFCITQISPLSVFMKKSSSSITNSLNVVVRGIIDTCERYKGWNLPTHIIPLRVPSPRPPPHTQHSQPLQSKWIITILIF